MMEYSRIAPVMGRLWSPIAAVTSRWQSKSNAQICVAIGAASIVPSMPRVVVQIYKRNYSHEMVYRSGAFALNYLRIDQLQYIKDFGLVSGRDVDKLGNVPHTLKSSGCPILEDCWGYLDCRVVNAMDGGDMTCFLGEVLDGNTLSDSEPLWWRHARTVIPTSWMEEWDRKISSEIEHSVTSMEAIDYSPWESQG
ncbi:MAG: flavin reductase family protein [Dehalococcoidia bacterium]|nr:flavin reductase family protein [Dehalococcoidia bacterium]